MSPQVEAALIAAGVGVLTVATTAFTQYLGRRATSKQLDRTLAEQRTRTLNERFATAAEQLGSDKPAVRLAGVHAMAGLADDWERKENRQTCVDVLCAYLRMPYEPDPGQDVSEAQRLAFQAMREVRHTVIRVITTHLRVGAAVSWRGLNFDFTGVVFDGGDFSGAEFSGGAISFDRARFSGGTVSFDRAEFSGGTVTFVVAFSGGTVTFNYAEFSGSTVSFYDAPFSGDGVSFDHARFSGGTVSFDLTRFLRGTVSFLSAEFSGGTVSFKRASFSGGTVDFSDAKFSGGRVIFSDAKFIGGAVRFVGPIWVDDAPYTAIAEFTGGTVDFSGAADWSVPPTFPWTDTPPPGVNLPKQEDESQA